MRIEDEYTVLEQQMLGYEDYCGVPVKSSREVMVPILGSMSLTTSIIREDAIPITGKRTYVREGVYERLVQSAAILNEQSGLTLDVCYGYRALSVQQARFEQALQRVSAAISGKERLATAHRQVAAPEVAGHPAGAAVDVRLLKDGIGLDFGTELWEYKDGLEGKRSYYGAPDISPQARWNRRVLRKAMVASGFAPFDGEWWHFSYGDKEWARYYNKSTALYDQIEFRGPDV